MLNYYDYVRANPEENRQFSCKDILYLMIDCPPEFTYAEDWAHHNSFIYVLAGKKHLFTRDGRTWDLLAGSSAFIKKGCFGLQKVGNEPFCVLMFYVPDEYICSFIHENRNALPIPDLTSVPKEQILHIVSTPVMTGFFESIIPYFSTNTQPAENLLELKFRELLLNIISTPGNSGLISYFCNLSQNSPDHLRDIMENNFLYNLQLHEFARLSHRSLSKFKRDFEILFGITPGRWLIEKRLEHASRLLLNSEKSITDIVMESGFTNITHFDRVFKNQFGLSPLQYRKKGSVNARQHALT
jgi:AraC family transcriptional regulator, exoenzyme S synthesis regulatory protein ExsA